MSIHTALAGIPKKTLELAIQPACVAGDGQSAQSSPGKNGANNSEETSDAAISPVTFSAMTRRPARTAFVLGQRNGQPPNFFDEKQSDT